MYSLRGSEPTALEAVGCEWRCALLVMQARTDDDDDDDDDDCIESSLHLENCHACLWRIPEIFIETLNKNVTEFFNVRKFREILQ